MINKKILALTLVGIAMTSCASPNLAIAPVTGPSNLKAITVKAKNVKFTKDTKPSQVLQVSEVGTSGWDRASIQKSIGPVPPTTIFEAGVYARLVFKNSDTNKTNGAIQPFVYVKSLGLAQEKIDILIPQLQKKTYQSLAKQYEIISN